MQGDRHDLVPVIEATPVEHGMRLWWLGGPSYVLKTPQSLIYVDPFHSGPRDDDPDGFNRAIPNVFFPEDVTRADLVLSTHDHLDHCDPDTLKPMYARTSIQLAVAPSSAKMIAEWGFDPQRVHQMPPGKHLTIGDVTLHTYPSNDWEDEEAVTMVLQAAGKTLFIGGDTMWLDDLEGIGKSYAFDLAIFALGRNHRDRIDKQLYGDPAELARAALALGTRRVLPIHWDIWKGWLENPHLVTPHLAGTGTTAVILGQGESLEL